ncbi:tRNA (5-methylaminomethyl-2-thiouridine)(34)-methyltransferase MnmD [Asticcacaulis solisilvae]|uniref:tRNA (5-methylaminomethyl-2-thiouridine)(34)-methyltransferase MnmD n=1 Tax=Asticcacaulis solisilvae TaxID=1217274 RepID=UPI003FD839A1
MPGDPELYFAEDGAPRSARFGDIYYSLQDGLAESRAVFLDGCRLPGAWTGGGVFSVLELGFGTGLNIVALMERWAANRPAGGYLHVFTIEGFLMTRAAAAQALDAWPELAVFSGALLAQWPGARTGFHYMDFPEWGVSVTLALTDVRSALDLWQGRADAIFLDGFSPALNPDMWAEDVLMRVAAHAAPGAVAATFTVAGFVRRGLQAAGFAVDKRPGFGRKRERLEAIFPGGRAEPPRKRRVAVVGAGIAGAALCHHARLFNIDADLFDANGPASGTSGNAAGLVTPRLDAGNDAVTGLFADALYYAHALYAAVAPDAILHEGTYLCEGPRDAQRFDRLATVPQHAEGDIVRVSEVPDVAGRGGLHFKAALAVRPPDLVAALIGNQAVRRESIIDWRREADGTVTLKTDAGEARGYDAVVLACGAGIFPFAPGLSLQAVRGQIEQMKSDDRPSAPVSWGGYIVPLNDGFVFGATHDRDDAGTEVRDEDRVRNLGLLGKAMPGLAEAVAGLPSRSRAGVRVASRDHLPRIGEIAPGVHVLTGLGGRGLSLAPLMARAVMADIAGLPPQLPAAAKNLLCPDQPQDAV